MTDVLWALAAGLPLPPPEDNAGLIDCQARQLIDAYGEIHRLSERIKKLEEALLDAPVTIDEKACLAQYRILVNQNKTTRRQPS